MAKPILQNPIIRGKAAKEFTKLFPGESKLTPEKMERNKRDIELYLSIVEHK